MSERILTELTQLDMPRVQFSCEFRETELTVAGADAVAFYMSANAGEALKPMSKVASGGELARIMLAMKNVLAEKDQVETLIFDEVEAEKRRCPQAGAVRHPSAPAGGIGGQPSAHRQAGAERTDIHLRDASGPGGKKAGAGAYHRRRDDYRNHAEKRGRNAAGISRRFTQNLCEFTLDKFRSVC